MTYPTSWLGSPLLQVRTVDEYRRLLKVIPQGRAVALVRHDGVLAQATNTGAQPREVLRHHSTEPNWNQFWTFVQSVYQADQQHLLHQPSYWITDLPVSYLASSYAAFQRHPHLTAEEFAWLSDEKADQLGMSEFLTLHTNNPSSPLPINIYDLDALDILVLSSYYGLDGLDWDYIRTLSGPTKVRQRRSKTPALS
jgi:hypothetical protein